MRIAPYQATTRDRQPARGRIRFSGQPLCDEACPMLCRVLILCFLCHCVCHP